MDLPGEVDATGSVLRCHERYSSGVSTPRGGTVETSHAREPDLHGVAAIPAVEPFVHVTDEFKII